MRRPAAPLLLRQPSRFAGLPRAHARAILAAVALLVLASLLALAVPPSDAPPASGGGGVTDLLLYRQIVEAIRHGEPFYPATADALRAGGYPLRPFVAFRLPTLAVVQAALPPIAVVAMLWALALGVVIAWGGRLLAALPRPAGLASGLLLLLGGTIACWQAELAPFHELWAGLLLALSLALWRPGRWIEAVAFGLAAALIRELAAPYLIVMGILAFRDGRRDEAAGWFLGLALLTLAVALHAHAVAQVVHASDPASPGWTGLGGIGFVARALAASTALSLLPPALAAPLVALSLVGWVAWRHPLALRVAATLAAFAAMIGLFARPDNFYWALLVAPVSLIGLAFVPDALRDLLTAALDTRRITVRRLQR